jgi:hypothetical protein
LIPESEIPPFYRGYASQLKGKDFFSQMKDALQETVSFLESIPDEKWDFAYAQGKWTIKEVVLHIIDAERIFAYRALRFSRNDKTELAGFDEDFYVPNSGASVRSKESLIGEYVAVRNSTLQLFGSMTSEMMLRTGVANANTISVRAIGLAIAGHEMHHMKVIEERYLK